MSTTHGPKPLETKAETPCEGIRTPPGDQIPSFQAKKGTKFPSYSIYIYIYMSLSLSPSFFLFFLFSFFYFLLSFLFSVFLSFLSLSLYVNSCLFCLFLSLSLSLYILSILLCFGGGGVSLSLSLFLSPSLFCVVAAVREFQPFVIEAPNPLKHRSKPKVHETEEMFNLFNLFWVHKCQNA